jgi:hypothetical protein
MTTAPFALSFDRKEVVAWQLDEAMKKKKNIQKQDGHTAENQPHPGGPATESEERHHAIQPATGGRDGGTASDDRAGLMKK